MSLKTWKQEFYTCEAKSRKAAKDPIGHSLRKWEGLLKKNVKKHEVYVVGLTLADSSNNSLEIDADSCALCRVFYDDDADVGSECDRCQILKATGSTCLAKFDSFWSKNDPRPMVNLLRKTKKFAEKEKANG